MALVHLGKTAGSTLSQNLRHGCHMFTPHPCRGSKDKNFGTKGGPGEESTISQLTKGYYHFNPVPVNKHDGYIISSRNPIDRVLSAFIYIHPENVAYTTNHRAKFVERNKGKDNEFVDEYQKFFECFPTVNALAASDSNINNGDGGDGDGDGGDENGTINKECAHLRRFLLNGGDEKTLKNEMLNHFAFGYKYYVSGLLAADRSTSRIFVLRQEHLAKDWINFNVRLGGEPHEMSGLRTKSFAKDKLAVKIPPGGLNKKERHNLCLLLKEEIQIYLGAIEEADNLTEEEKARSRQEIENDCSPKNNHENPHYVEYEDSISSLPQSEAVDTNSLQALNIDLYCPAVSISLLMMS
eukprot:CAMPEP_0194127746 /NCGR_PEP_ID=MMETSP0150-20130528/60685_1 /TAXON_ID=122233 /ORGANISM="Chaetoceros debilis, Strain MM31A-1" /LENGTH=352 /DNA_ID=CAMNT_0038821691 /DNA_START=307 /DNA_END=1365 /DNA_ORIENTATION=-